MDIISDSKALKVYSNIIIVLAGVDAVRLTTHWVNGEFNSTVLAQVYGVPKNIIHAIIMAVLCVGALVFAAKIYMGIKGIRTAKGNGKGTGHITVAKVTLVCCITMFAISTITLISNISGAGMMEWLDLAAPFASCLITSEYLKAAKEIG